MVKWRENPNAVPGTYAAVVVGGELSIVVISVEAGESWGLTGQPAWPTKSMRYHFRKEKKKRCHLWNGNLCFPLASMCMRKHTHPQGKYTQGPRVFSTAGVPLNAILYSPGVSDTQPCLVGWVASLRSCAPHPVFHRRLLPFNPLTLLPALDQSFRVGWHIFLPSVLQPNPAEAEALARGHTGRWP